MNPEVEKSFLSKSTVAVLGVGHQQRDFSRKTLIAIVGIGVGIGDGAGVRIESRVDGKMQGTVHVTCLDRRIKRKI